MSAAPHSLSESASVMRMRAAFEQHNGANIPLRQAAFATFSRAGFPTPRDEQWKYTNLRRLESREFTVSHPDAPYTSVIFKPANVYPLVFIDGYYRPELSTPPTSSAVKITSLLSLQQSDPQQFATFSDIKTHQSSSMTALNTALMTDGIMIEAADNATLDQPIFLTFLWSDTELNLMAHPRIVIRTGKHAHLTVIQHYLDTGSTSHFNNSVTTVQLAAGSKLEHCLIQNENNHSFHVSQIHAELAQDSTLINHHFNFGAALARTDINALLKGPEAKAILNGLQFATGHQHHDTHLQVEHCVPHTQSHEDYRGIADQRGRIVFNGKVKVHEKAAKTDAQQSSRNLLLSSTAEIDAKPELEIYNDDVKCAHGATIGQLDANALFYLRSRGLDEQQARALLTHAFANHIITQVPVPEMRQQLTETSHVRFGAQLEYMA